MASQEVTEFCVLKFKHPDSEPTAAWDEVTTSLQSVPGVSALYFGPQIEDPATYVLIIQWASHAAFTGFSRSEAFTPWFAKYKALVEEIQMYQAPLNRDASPVFAAPCTEIFTAYGVEPGFIESTGNFAGKVDDARDVMEGYHGSAYGEITTPIAKGDGEKGPAVTLVIGWDSKEAHIVAKSKPGPIDENINLLRTGRKDVALYHVNLKKL